MTAEDDDAYARGLELQRRLPNYPSRRPGQKPPQAVEDPVGDSIDGVALSFLTASSLR